MLRNTAQNRQILTRDNTHEQSVTPKSAVLTPILLISQKYMRQNTFASVVASWLLPPASGESWDGGDAARDDAPIPARCIDQPVTIRSKFDSNLMRL